MDFIDIKTQYQKYKQEIDLAIHEVLDEGNFILGRQVKELEEALGHYLGVKHCIGVSNGTESLIIALRALGIGPGDEVITVPFTWISTPESIALVGATPVFVDIDPETYNIDTQQIEASITSKTKALLPVSLFGQMPDIENLHAISKKYGIPIIEDAAQSIGAEQNGKKSGGEFLIGSTSFFPSKTLGCYGDGGALFTDNDSLANQCRHLRSHGSIVRHHHEYIGTNARLDTLQAAILLVKLRHLPEEIAARIRIAQRYTDHLKEVCSVPKTSKGNKHVYHQYTVRVQNRNSVIEEMQKNEVPVNIYYPRCVHLQPAFSYLGKGLGSFPVAERASDEVLSLPMHAFLNEKDQDRVIKTLKNAVLEECLR